MKEYQLQGRKVVITGAAGIVGSRIAKAFSEAGAKLLLSDVRLEELEKLRHELDLKDQEVLLHQTDLTNTASMDELVETIDNNWGAADILVNNAGVYFRAHLKNMPLKEWDQIMQINVTAPFYLTQKLSGQMIQHQREGSIINISSGAALVTNIGGGHYSVSKAALSMLTRSFALELAPHRIRVNAVAPGFAPGSEVSILSDTYVENMISTIPLGRTSGPNDAANAVLFLCSEKASFITGATLNVDGGKSAGNYKAEKGGA